MKFFHLIKYDPIYVDKAADEDSVLDGVGLDGLRSMDPRTYQRVGLALPQQDTHRHCRRPSEK